MWILLWLVLSLIIMGVFFWSTGILMQQKKAWLAAARNLSLTYDNGGRFMASPSIKGKLGRFEISLFTDEQKTPDARGQRYITAIEIEMGAGLPTGAVIAAPAFTDFLAPVNADHGYQPYTAEWSEHYVVKTKDAALLTSYMTPERLKLLQSLFAMKNAQPLLFFEETDSILRIETSDPLTDAARLEKLVRRLAAGAEILGPPAGVVAAVASPLPVAPVLRPDAPLPGRTTPESAVAGPSPDMPTGDQADGEKPI